MAQKILIIDDEEILAKTFRLLLQKTGYDVYSVKNGRDAQIMAEEEDFELIICDIRMPGMDGVETMRAIQAKGKKTPVIFVTGFADDALESKAKECHPIAYLYKPFDSHRFLTLIKEAIGS